MPPEQKPFPQFVENFLLRGYDSDSTSSWSPAQATDPLGFYDAHVASNLILKSVKPAPWLLDNLSILCQEEIDKFVDEGNMLDPDKFPRPPPRRADFDTVYNIKEYYDIRIGEPCQAFASKLVFLRNSGDWPTVLRSTRDGRSAAGEGFLYHSGLTMAKNIAEETGPLTHENRQIFEAWVRPTLRGLDELGILAVWEYLVLSKQSELLLKRMEPTHKFTGRISATKGFSAINPTPVPTDSQVGKYLLNPISKKPRKHEKKSLPQSNAENQPVKQKVIKANKRVVAPTRYARNRESHYRPNPAHFLQVAWNRAVTSDATFIIINCGKYERIGVRHRATQTLYLSELISTSTFVGYGSVHGGLHLAILRDAIDRLKAKDLQTVSTPTTQKDPARPVVAGVPTSSPSGIKRSSQADGGPRKRQKLQSKTKDIFAYEASKREMAFFFIDFRTYFSPAPYAFIRLESSCVPGTFRHASPIKRKGSYTSESYMAMTVTDPMLGFGASGGVHHVTVELEDHSGDKQFQRSILKLAMWKGSREKMLQEYSVYQKLSEAGVTDGIVGVHGLFEDMESGMLAMLMDDAGKSLAQIYEEERDGRGGEDLLDPRGYPIVSITDEQRVAFTRALEGIHKAHIVHDDIRLNNLMIDAEGHPKIIDFDLGVHDPDMLPGRYAHDMNKLLAIMQRSRTNSGING